MVYLSLEEELCEQAIALAIIVDLVVVESYKNLC